MNILTAMDWDLPMDVLKSSGGTTILTTLKDYNTLFPILVPISAYITYGESVKDGA